MNVTPIVFFVRHLDVELVFGPWRNRYLCFWIEFYSIILISQAAPIVIV